MAHQTGIIGSKELVEKLAQARKGKIRIMKIGIQNESLVLESTGNPSGTWQQDYDGLVLPCLTQDQPCFILYRLDTRLPDGSYEWIFISFIPETSTTRHKMVYAATKMTLKKEMKGLNIKEELTATTVSDASLEGYMQHIRSQSAPKPLTNAEKELQLIRQNEEEMSRQGKRQTIQATSFPLSTEAQEKLQLFKLKKINYIQLSVDTSKEVINLESANCIGDAELIQQIPDDHPRYHFYCYRHAYRGASYNSIVFIYSIPSGKSTIREKMLYSTCKSPLLQFVEQNIDIVVDKKIETDSPNELTDEFLIDQIHPVVSEYTAKGKPTNPGKMQKNGSGSPAFLRKF